MVRKLLVAIILLFSLVACEQRQGVFVTYTPSPSLVPKVTETPVIVVVTATPSVTASPTQTVEPSATKPPTPTQEIGLPINTNPDMRFPEVVVLQETADNRYQCEPRDISVFVEYHLLASSQRTPPFINCSEAADGGRYIIEITEVDGRFGYRTSADFNAEQCYLAKWVGAVDVSLIDQGNLSNITLGARIHSNGSIINLPQQDFKTLRGISESVFPFWTERTNASAEVDLFVEVDFAVFAGTVEFWKMQVLAVPFGFCDGVEAW